MTNKKETNTGDAITFMFSVDTKDEFIGKEEFCKTTKKLDNLRQERFWDVFPEHLDMMPLMEGLNE